MRKTQRRIWEDFQRTKDKHTISVLLCSRKLGKSHLAMMGLSSICLSKRDAICCYIAPTLSSVSELVSQLTQSVFKTCPEYLKPIINKNEIIFPTTGSKIMCAGVGKGIGDSYDNLRSFSFDAVVLDEAGFPRNLKEIVTGALLDTVRVRKGPIWLLSSAPKEGIEHPFWDYVNQSRMNGTLHEYTIMDSGYSKEEIDKAIEEHGGIDAILCRRELFNEPLIDEEFQLVPEFKNQEPHVKPIIRDEFWPFYHKYVSMDPSQGVDFTSVLFAYFDYRRQVLVIEDEIEMHGKELITKDLAINILALKRSLGYDKPFLELSDSNEPRLLRDLAQDPYNLYFSPITDKGNKPSQISRLREMFRDNRIEINPKCTYLISCLTSGLWAADGQGRVTSVFDKSKTLGHFDAIDALAYMCLLLNIHTNPIPADFNTRYNTVLPDLPKSTTKIGIPKNFVDNYRSNNKKV